MKLKITIKIILLMIILGGCAGWSNTDKALMTSFTIGHFLDYMQTLEILRNDEYYEINPVIDKYFDEPWETATYFALTEGFVYLLADNLGKYKKWYLGLANMISWGCVYNNYKIGVRIQW